MTGKEADDGLPEEQGDVSDANPLGASADPASASAAGSVDADPAPDQDPLGAAPVTADDVLLQTAKERDEYLDALRRLQAEFENYKKRMAKQNIEQAARGAEQIVESLLPVLDTMDLALSHDPSGSLEQVVSALREALARQQLESIDKTGVIFDPTVHDAVAHEPDDGENAGDPEVVEVMRSGYRYKGRVLRPAMVKVRG